MLLIVSLFPANNYQAAHKIVSGFMMEIFFWSVCLCVCVCVCVCKCVSTCFCVCVFLKYTALYLLSVVISNKTENQAVHLCPPLLYGDCVCVCVCAGGGCHSVYLAFCVSATLAFFCHFQHRLNVNSMMHLNLNTLVVSLFMQNCKKKKKVCSSGHVRLQCQCDWLLFNPVSHHWHGILSDNIEADTVVMSNIASLSLKLW